MVLTIDIMRHDRYKQVPRGRFGGGHARGSFRADRAGGQDGALGGDDPRASGDGHVHDSSDRGKDAFFVLDWPTGTVGLVVGIALWLESTVDPGVGPDFLARRLAPHGRKAPQGKIFVRRKIAVVVITIYSCKSMVGQLFSRFCSRALFFFCLGKPLLALLSSFVFFL